MSASQAWYFKEQLPSATYVAILRCGLMTAVGYVCLRDMWPPNGFARFVAIGLLLAVSVVAEKSFVTLVGAVMRLLDHGGEPFAPLLRGLSVALFWPSYGLLGTSTLSTVFQMDGKEFIFASGTELICIHMFLIVPVMIAKILLQNWGRRARSDTVVQVAIILIAVTLFSAGLALIANVIVAQQYDLMVNQMLVSSTYLAAFSLEIIVLLRVIKY
jgi:hypothetical protein